MICRDIVPDDEAQPQRGREDVLDVANWATGVEGLGPGKRVVLWVRGCPLACLGCMTPELWAKGSANSHHPVEEVAALLSPLLQNADGLTISGGEPMQQAPALTRLVRLLRVDAPDLEVVVYSGYRLEELHQRGAETLAFLEEIDILIDGRFEESASNDLKWRGSDNQRIRYLSLRGQRYNSEGEEMPLQRPLQIQPINNEEFRIIGIPKRGDMERYRQVMEQRGILVAQKRRE